MEESKEKNILHPAHQHPLLQVEGLLWTKFLFEGARCHGCGLFYPSAELRGCRNCRYYLCKKFCFDKLESELLHPLHPQHYLTLDFNEKNIPNVQTKFQCSFCGKTKKSGFFYHCDHCDFYLDIECLRYFSKKKKLLKEYEIQHFLHDQDNHRLSPYYADVILYSKWSLSKPILCNGCGGELNGFHFKCNCSRFGLHVGCCQVAKEEEYDFHPQHPLELELALVLNPPEPEPERLSRCFACRMEIKDVFFLHCSKCPFNIHITCAFTEPEKHENHHDHVLYPVEKIYPDPDDDDVRCSACNIICKTNILRCFQCNFSIHRKCVLLPITVSFDDHVHKPLTLASSHKNGDYYCAICEKKRDADHGVYCCKEQGCRFATHFGCVLPKDHPYVVLLKDDDDLEESKKELNQYSASNQLLTDDERALYTSLTQLETAVGNIRTMVGYLIFLKRQGRQVTVEYQQRHLRIAQRALQQLEPREAQATPYVEGPLDHWGHYKRQRMGPDDNIVFQQVLRVGIVTTVFCVILNNSPLIFFFDENNYHKIYCCFYFALYISICRRRKSKI